MGEVWWNPCTTNGLKCKGINWILWKWRLLHPVDPWPSYPLGKPSRPLDSNSYKNHHAPLGREHKRSRDARREINTLPHALGHDPRGKRLGRKVDQNSRSPDRAASLSGTSRYPTRTEFGRHLVQSRQATHTRLETQSPRPGLDGRETPSQTHCKKHL